MIFFNIISLFLLQILPAFALHKTTCYPADIIPRTGKTYGLEIFGTRVNIDYKMVDVNINDNPATIMEISIERVNVTFTGYTYLEQSNTNEEIELNFNMNDIKIQFFNITTKYKNNYYCKLVSSEKQTINSNFGEKIESSIIRRTKDCIRSYLCQLYDYMVAYDFLENSSNNNSAISKSENPCLVNDLTDGTHNPQTTINAMIDFGVAALIKKFSFNNITALYIPEIKEQMQETYLLIIPVTVFVKTSEGLLSGLENLKRTGDVVLKKEGYRFSVSTSYRLPDLKVTFNEFNLKYNTETVEKALTFSLNQVTLNAEMEFDYNHFRCVAKLTNFNMQLDELKFELHNLNYKAQWAEKMATKILKNKIYSHVKNTLSDVLNEFDCEKFRPSKDCNI